MINKIYKSITNKIRLVFLLCVVMLASCGPHYNIQSGQAFFQNFEYSGNDSYFDSTLIENGKMWNPILQGSHPGTSICRKGNDFYMASASFGLFPALPIYHSTDLVNWELINFALPTEHQYLNSSLSSNEGIYPPTIRYNQQKDMFYISGTFIGGGGHFIVSAKDPKDKWSEPTYIFGMMDIHASLFFDDNGKTYLIHHGDPTYKAPYDGFKVIYIQEFDLEHCSTIGERIAILEGGHNLELNPGWLEAPHIYKHEGYYYLSASEGGSLGDRFASCIYRSQDILGPYEHYENNPNLTQRYLPRKANQISCVGYADYLELADGRWYVVFQGIREDEFNNNFMCNETFLLPVTWTEEGWPTVLEHNQAIPRVIDMPFAGTAYSKNKKFVPHGNIKINEQFLSDSLTSNWSFLRTPIGKSIIPNAAPGIILPLEINNFRSQRHTGFICMRVYNNKFSFGTTMDFMPETNHEFAGLAIFLSDRNNMQYGVTLQDDKIVLQLKRVYLKENLISEVVSQTDISDSYKGHIMLKIDNFTENVFTVQYRFNQQDEWITLSNNFTTNYMNVNTIGNHSFVGNFIGLYASQEE